MAGPAMLCIKVHCYEVFFTVQYIAKKQEYASCHLPKEDTNSLCVDRSGRGSCGGFYVDSVQYTVRSLYHTM